MKSNNVVKLPVRRRAPATGGDDNPVLAEVRARLDRLNKRLAIAELHQQRLAEASTKADEALCRLGDEVDALMAIVRGGERDDG